MLFRVVIGLSLLLNPFVTNGARILGIFPYPGPSQYICAQTYFKALAARGHDVTVISAFPQKEKIPNFHDIPVIVKPEMYAEIMAGMTTARNKWAEMNFFTEFFTMVELEVLENAEVQRQLFQEKPHFDLVVIEVLYLEALYAFGQHFNAPLIGISTFGTDPTIDDLVDNISPVSYVPLVTSDMTDRMNFWQRLKNVVITGMERLHLHTVHLPMHEKIYRKYFPEGKGELVDLRRNFSLMLMNQHFSLSFARPYVPNMIEVGGMHLNTKTPPIPEDMAKFLDESDEAGVIYFSMGSNVQSKDFPKETLDIILRVFASLPQRVMWKFEDDQLPGKPDNVFIAKWFPQPAILAHPQVKLFITHGGLLSTIEAIHHGVPVVGMPIFYDQFLNVARAEQAGFGIGIKFNELTEQIFGSAIKQVLWNTSYTTVAKTLSARYHDQPQTPLEKAIFWTEYVLRHKGAPHMRVSAQYLNLLEHHSVDTIGFLVGVGLLVLLLLVLSIRKLVQLIFGLHSPKKEKHQ